VKIGNERLLAIPYTLIALDSQVPIDDPLSSPLLLPFRINGTPIQRFSLNLEPSSGPFCSMRSPNVADDNVEIAGVVDLICRNILPHLQSGGEREIITKFRDRVREISQLEAEKQ